MSVTDYVTALLQLYNVISAYELTHLIIDADVGVGVVDDIDDDFNHISASYSLGEVVELKCKRKYEPCIEDDIFLKSKYLKKKTNLKQVEI